MFFMGILEFNSFEEREAYYDTLTKEEYIKQVREEILEIDRQVRSGEMETYTMEEFMQRQREDNQKRRLLREKAG